VAERRINKLAAGQQFRLLFGVGGATVENAAAQKLFSVATALKADNSLRLQLLAYSGSGIQTPSQSRRLSLSRALSVRSYLIEKGVLSTRIEVRALGNKSKGGPPDRVDMIVNRR
jgi:outer membrane protein OmpA-like peptidoglycan-associated protein